MRVAYGQIWAVDLDPTVANEQAGVRPCIVVSTQRYNELPIRYAIVVPLTTRHRGFPHHVAVDDDGSLHHACWAMCEAVRALSTQRFGRLIGMASNRTVEAIARRVTMWVGTL